MIKIVLVEDDQDLSELIRLTLEIHGYDVVSEFNGLTAWNLLQQEQVDLILLDIMLPEMDGFELNHRLKTGNTNRNTPVIMMSGWEQTALALKAKETARILDFLEKPFALRILLDKIGTAFDSKLNN